MSLFTPAVLVTLALAAVCALLAWRLRSRFLKNTLLLAATALLVFAVWLDTSTAWALRDGFFPSPRADWSETHGLAAAEAFLRDFWVTPLAAVAVVALIAASWRHRATELRTLGSSRHGRHRWLPKARPDAALPCRELASSGMDFWQGDEGLAPLDSSTNKNEGLGPPLLPTR
jgi:hypothetical protein